MSESGEINEFGYIMELLAKGKVSARGARGVMPRVLTLGTARPGA